MADFVVGDSNSKLVAVLLRRNGAAIDLTGRTVNLRYRIGVTTYSAKAMTIVQPPSIGTVSYLFAAVDLANEGIMYAEIEVTETATGKILSNSSIEEFIVRGKTT